MLPALTVPVVVFAAHVVFFLLLLTLVVRGLVTGRMVVAKTPGNVIGDRRDAPVVWWLLWSVQLAALIMVAWQFPADFSYELVWPFS